MIARKTSTAWGVLLRKSANCLDGPSERLCGRHLGPNGPTPPVEMEGFNLLAFRTRRECRRFVRERWGYMKDRPDLRDWPHGDLMPKPVKISITVEANPQPKPGVA